MIDYDIGELIIGNDLKIKSYGEHDGKFYYAYFDNMPPSLFKFKFHKRWRLEEFLYRNGIEQFDYKSSNGSIIHKVWEHIPSKVAEWEHLYKTKNQLSPEKYSWKDFDCGHFVKEKRREK